MISGLFVDEEVCVLYLLLGMFVLLIEGNFDVSIFDEFFVNKLRYLDVSVIGVKGLVIFDLLGVCSMKKLLIICEFCFFMVVMVIRIV